MISFRKLIYYRDIRFLIRAIRLQWLATRREGRALLALADVPVSGRSRRDVSRIARYAGAACRIGGWFGLLNTCLSVSLVTCRLLRENGVDARVVFGMRKGSPDEGHCWVEAEGLPPAPRANDYDELMKAPGAEEKGIS